jgi:hypothetical protein
MLWLQGLRVAVLMELVWCEDGHRDFAPAIAPLVTVVPLQVDSTIETTGIIYLDGIMLS